MRLNTILVALFLVRIAQAQDVASAQRIAAGKEAWDAKLCRRCHGDQGEGGYGPDLAGRSLSLGQFRRAIRQPWGVMPAFSEQALSEQNLADIAVYLSSLPKVLEPAAWRVPLPASDAPRGQVLLIANGCGQCHGPELAAPRSVLGGEASEVDFPFFAKIIYEHFEGYPAGRMGSFSMLRLPEATLQEIFRFATEDLGLMVPISAKMGVGAMAGANTTYTLTLKNRGSKGKGLTAENVTIALALATGTTVVNGTGLGYQGVGNDAQLKSRAAVWLISRIVPQEEQTYTLTVAGTGGSPAELFKGSVVRWTKPEIRKGVPNLALRDPGIPGRDSQIAITFPPPQSAQR